MGGLRINFAEVEGSFEPLPEGHYECVVNRVEVRESNSSDNDYLNWELKVQEPDEYEGRNLWMITSLSERALFRLKDTFLALGVIEEDDEVELEWDDGVDITPKEGPLLLNPDVEGLSCTAIVTNEMYDGRERNRVQEIQGNGAAPAKETKKKATSSTSSKKASGSKKPARRRKMR